jgi:hypothetical protein
MSLYKPGRESDAPPSEHVIAALGQLIEDMAKAGTLIATDGLQPSSMGARVRIDNGKLTVTDGPFAETKELIGGYAILNAKSKEEAIELTKRFLSLMGEGECEVRLMQDEPGFEAEHSQPAEVAAKR